MQNERNPWAGSKQESQKVINRHNPTDAAKESTTTKGVCVWISCKLQTKKSFWKDESGNVELRTDSVLKKIRTTTRYQNVFWEQ